MENNFPAHQYDYLNQTHPEIKQQINHLQVEQTESKNKESNQKQFWRSFNVFSKIKKSSKAKSVKEETLSQIIRTNLSLKKCKSNEMNDKSSSEENDEDALTNSSTKSTESKPSFFGKLNLENFLKIFSDLHKKKQATQAALNNIEVVGSEKEEEKYFDTVTENLPNADLSKTQTLQRCTSSSNITIYSGITEISSSNTENLQNPNNSPSTTIGNNEETCLSTFKQQNVIPKSDSTLSLLENVRTKLKDYLLSEIINDTNDIRASDALCERMRPKENIVQDIKAIEKKNPSEVVIDETNSCPIDYMQGNSKYPINIQQENTACPVVLPEENLQQEHAVCSIELPEGNAASFMDSTHNPIDSIQGNTSAEGCNDKKLAYTIVESDIKCMIKELLKESKNIKSSIVAYGIEEEPTPLFTEIKDNFDSFLLCQGICADLINVVANKPRSILKAKSKPITHVTFKTQTTEDVEIIVTNLVETVLMQPVIKSKQIFVNFCLVQRDNLRNSKRALEIAAAKFRASRVYYLTKKLREMPSSCKKISLTPKVTVRNLSIGTRIKFLSIENSLTTRIRRSAALLMALYDEMRDYSYYSCTSNILSDLYESMVKQGLISVITENMNDSIGNLPIDADNDQTVNNNSNETTRSTGDIKNVENNVPCSSCGNKLDIPNLIPCLSKDSFSSESDEEKEKEQEKLLLLPNLKYTHQSEEEINTPEEIKMIDDNIRKNEGKCESISINEGCCSNESIDAPYEGIDINENESFLKE